MPIYYLTETFAPWLAPYAYGIVLLGFAFFLLRVFENWYAARYNRPLFRNYLIYRKLSSSQEAILHQDFSFYKNLSSKHQKQFRHRVASFLSKKDFMGRDGLVVTPRMELLVAAMACWVTFGRKNYDYGLIEKIVLFPNNFTSAFGSQSKHWELNPRERIAAFSWPDFEMSLSLQSPTSAVALHAFIRALHLESQKSRDLDSIRFAKQFHNILRLLAQNGLKDKLNASPYFQHHPFSDQYGFMAVLGAYFFEKPSELKENFPQLYGCVKKMFNFDFLHY